METNADRLANTKLRKRGEQVANIIASKYQIGDAIILDTTNGTRYFGFYVGINEFPRLMVMVAHSCVNFNGEWDKKWFQGIISIPTSDIQYFNAVPVKQ